MLLLLYICFVYLFVFNGKCGQYSYAQPHFSTAIFGIMLWITFLLSSKYKRLNGDNRRGEQHDENDELNE